MSAARRIEALEQEAGDLLRRLGYEPVIVSGFVRTCRYIAFHLAAHKKLDDGSVDSIMVKLKVSLHPIETLTEAAEFCREEIAGMKKFFAQIPPEGSDGRFEVWISVPLNRFQHFEITREGIREIRSPADRPGYSGVLP